MSEPRLLSVTHCLSLICVGEVAVNVSAIHRIHEKNVWAIELARNARPDVMLSSFCEYSKLKKWANRREFAPVAALVEQR